MSASSKSVQALAKFIAYVLGRHPDEFGLIPDELGFVKIKELLKALHEEPGWTYVRPDHLNELQFSSATNVIEIQDEKVRARERDRLPRHVIPEKLPGVLYTTVRRRAYPFVHDQGLRALPQSRIVLSSHNEMARRLGKRIDAHPVLLTVQVSLAQSAGTQFNQYGDKLFVADFIPTSALQGPPLPKTPYGKRTAPEPERPRTPGSYFPDAAAIEDPGATTGRPTHRKEKDWKKGRRAARRHKERQRRGT